MTKGELRAGFRAQLRARQSLTLERALRSLEARVREWCGRLPAGQTLTLFGGLPGEPDLVSTAAEDLRAAGHRVALFALRADERGEMDAWSLEDGAGVRRGFGGVWEPEITRGRLISPAEIAVILVPGLFFCPQSGARLGRGGGFYDRYLARATSALKIGAALEWQLREGLPVEAHDQKMDAILTEERWLDFRR